jgi:hypothetical protein
MPASTRRSSGVSTGASTSSPSLGVAHGDPVSGADNSARQAALAGPLLGPEQVATAKAHNLKSHSVSMLSSLRRALIDAGVLTPAPVDSEDRVDVWPGLLADDSFVQAVAAYQQLNGLGRPDGKVVGRTFDHFQGMGLTYRIAGGNLPSKTKDANGKDVPRSIIPLGASDAAVYDYFRQVVLDQGGIWNDKAGYVNIVGVRGGQLGADSRSITATDNAFNQWNDTLLVLSVDAQGTKRVQYYAGTTDPGVRRAGVATLPEGTHAMEKGTPSPASGAYAALNPAYDATVPVVRRGEAYAGTERGPNGARGGGQYLNIHTTHGWSSGKLAGPGGYSEGCAVIDGEDKFKNFMSSVNAATKAESKGGPGQTLLYYTVISASRLGGVRVERQSPTR